MSHCKILYVCQEITPYLPESDMSVLCRALSQGMQERGNEIRTFMPRYGLINERRNQLHEVIRRCSHAASARMKEGEPCDLLEQLAAEPAFSMHTEDLAVLLRPEAYVGRCPEQVDTFLRKVRPLLEGTSGDTPDIDL